MKIVFTGGGTGGHFYPIIAVAEEVNALTRERKLVNVKLYFLSEQPYDHRALFDNGLEFVAVASGKWRRYFTPRNFLRNLFDLVRLGLGLVTALFKLYFIYPDVVFSKGGYASVPVVWAAHWLGLPVFIHESDTRPGRANLWASRFAKRIAVSYPEAVDYFKPADRGKIAVTGNPLRMNFKHPLRQGAREFLQLEPNRPVVFVTGGSQGARAINDVVVDILPSLLKEYAVIHQVGRDNFSDIKKRTQTVLAGHPQADRYKLFDYLNESAMRMVAGVSDLVISRAGSTIFEIAEWGIPAILIPIPEKISHDQRTNAFTYARTGAAVVIEQDNLLPSVLLTEINRLLKNQKLLETMRLNAKNFSKPNAARLIAEELIKIALSHER
ncbi:MAG: UDP-N-acetylglucosamine--N-acetylmuramyl-(pentapeptide) pyrophosphoryl-undecaprenol N-acetylglucosamine transferase [Patescibacteria group bacterium]